MKTLVREGITPGDDMKMYNPIGLL